MKIYLNKFYLILSAALIFTSCSKIKDQTDSIKIDNTSVKENISSAGVKENGVEFKVEYNSPRNVYKIEKEDLNNDGNKELIVLSILKDTINKFNYYFKFDMIEIFALNDVKTKYEKIFSDTVDYSDTCIFQSLANNNLKQILILTNAGGNDPISSEGMFVFNMSNNSKIYLVKYFEGGAPYIDSLNQDGKKQVIVQDRYWGVMPRSESIVYESEINEFENDSLKVKNSEFGEFYDKKIKVLKEKYYGSKKKSEMGMQPNDMSFPLYREACEVIVNYFAKEDMKGLGSFWNEESSFLKSKLPPDEFTDINNFVFKALPSAKNV